MPAVVTPYVWNARHAQGKVVISGHVPNDQIREDLFGAARKKFSNMAIVDRTEVAGGAPDGWAKVVALVLEQIALLEDATAELRGVQLNVVGRAPDEATASGIRKMLRIVPAAFKVTDDITYPEPESAPVAEAPPPEPEAPASQDVQIETPAGGIELRWGTAEDDGAGSRTRQEEDDRSRQAEVGRDSKKRCPDAAERRRRQAGAPRGAPERRRRISVAAMPRRNEAARIKAEEEAARRKTEEERKQRSGSNSSCAGAHTARSTIAAARLRRSSAWPRSRPRSSAASRRTSARSRWRKPSGTAASCSAPASADLDKKSRRHWTSWRRFRRPAQAQDRNFRSHGFRRRRRLTTRRSPSGARRRSSHI